MFIRAAVFLGSVGIPTRRDFKAGCSQGVLRFPFFGDVCQCTAAFTSPVFRLLVRVRPLWKMQFLPSIYLTGLTLEIPSAECFGRARAWPGWRQRAWESDFYRSDEAGLSALVFSA